VSCAKTAETIDLPFGLWTRAGPIKHKFNRIRQVAPMCRHGRAHWRYIGATLAPAGESTETFVCCVDAALLWSPYGLGQTIIFSCCGLFMVALCNRETIYIFMLWFVLLLSSSSLRSPYVIGRPYIFLPCSFFPSFFFFFFPRLISAAVDGMSTILLHMAWP